MIALAPIVARAGKADLVLQTDPLEVECPVCKHSGQYTKSEVITWLVRNQHPLSALILTCYNLTLGRVECLTIHKNTPCHGLNNLAYKVSEVY